MANGRIWLKVAPEAYLMIQCTDNDCQWCPCSCNNCMSTYNVKSTRLLSSYPQNFIHLFIHSPVKFLWLLIFTDTLMCSLLWPGHFDFFIVVLVIGEYIIGLETLYLAKKVGMINGKFAFIIFILEHNFVRKATTPGLEFFWFLNYFNVKYR